MQFQCEWDKWATSVSLNLSRLLVYKMNFVLQFLAPALIFLLIRWQVWNAVFFFNKIEKLGQYTLPEMLRYQALVLLIGLLTQSYHNRTFAEDIRYGKISAVLLFPFEFWKIGFASWIAFEGLQIAVVVLTFLTLLSAGILPLPDLGSVTAAFGFSLVVGVFWYVCQYTIGLFAFWFEETWMFRVVLLFLAQVLSGAMVPLSLFPDWAAKALAFTPFPYLITVPIKIYLGLPLHETMTALGVVLLWIGILSLGAQYLWSRGLQRYTAAGM